MLKDYILIIAAIIAIGTAYVFFEDKLSTPKAPTPTPTPQQIADQKFTTNDGRITISFPSTWNITETTVAGTYGQFGPYIQTFTISNYKATQTTIPQNGAKIDFVIEQGGTNLTLEALIDCGGKTITCERIGIDNEQFIQSTATLNTGMQTINLGTFYDQNVLVANAMLATGDKQVQNKKDVEKILKSITFNAPK